MWRNKATAEPPRWPILVQVALLAGLLGLAPVSGAAGSGAELPASLGQWYKPANKRQVWLHTMFAMRRELQAVREYAASGDTALAAKWADRLARHYTKLAQMVPEWREETDLSLTEELVRRIARGELAAGQRAADRLDNDCRSCHRRFQTLAALRFRWPRFDSLEIDEGDGEPARYPDFKRALAAVVNRIKIAADDGRWPAATQAYDQLITRLDRLGEGCGSCHDDPEPRERILGKDSRETLAQLQTALVSRDSRTAGRRLGSFAVLSCARCHSVHRILSDIQRHLFDKP